MTLAVKVIYGHVQVGPEFTLMMFQIAMTLVASGVILIVLNNLWKLLRKHWIFTRVFWDYLRSNAGAKERV